MIGFTKEEIVKLANKWIDENQQWADSVVIQAAQQAGTNPFEQLEACSLANFKKCYQWLLRPFLKNRICVWKSRSRI